MTKIINDWIKVFVVICMIVCSVVQIHLRMEAQNIVSSSGCRWDIFAFELLIISCFYALLLMRGKYSLGRKHRKGIHRSGQVKAC